MGGKENKTFLIKFSKEILGCAISLVFTLYLLLCNIIFKEITFVIKICKKILSTIQSSVRLQLLLLL